MVHVHWIFKSSIDKDLAYDNTEIPEEVVEFWDKDGRSKVTQRSTDDNMFEAHQIKKQFNEFILDELKDETGIPS